MHQETGLLCSMFLSVHFADFELSNIPRGTLFIYLKIGGKCLNLWIVFVWYTGGTSYYQKKKPSGQAKSTVKEPIAADKLIHRKQGKSRYRRTEHDM